MIDRSGSRAFNQCVALAAFVIAIGSTQFAAADVTFVGSVNPDPPAAGGTFATTSKLVVADDNDTNSADTRAWLSIDDGTLLQYGLLIVGDEEDFYGVVNVQGDFLASKNTQFNFSGQGSTGNPTVQVGNQGTGSITLGGGTMNVTNQSGNMSIGFATTGVGYVTVTDPFTILTVEDNIYVGQNGIGSLEVLNGALVRTLDNSSSRFIGIGTNATGVGNVVVDGVGSVLRSASTLIVGGTIAGTPVTYGQGTLRISNGGIVDVDNINLPTVTVGRLGRIELAGGTLSGRTPTTGVGTTVNGYVGGTGLVRGSINFGGDSSMEANSGDVLRFDGDVSNQGAVTIDDGEVRFLAGFTNNAASGAIPPGRISLEDGTVRFTESLTNNGVISSAHGANNIHGAITNQGAIVVASDTVASFFDTVNNTTGTITVLPRGNALFLADLTFTSMSALELGVGLNNTTDVSAQIGAGGAVTLGGDLTVEIGGSFTPVLGQNFELISADGGINGTFNNTFLPNIPGTLEWRVLYNPTSVLMEVRIEGTSIGLAGDYNGDNVVDAADFSVWRNNLGDLTEADIHNAGDGLNGVDAADYGVWKQHYGDSLEMGSGAIAGVGNHAAAPEPTALALVVIAILSGWAGLRPRHSAAPS